MVSHLPSQNSRNPRCRRRQPERGLRVRFPFPSWGCGASARREILLGESGTPLLTGGPMAHHQPRSNPSPAVVLVLAAALAVLIFLIAVDLTAPIANSGLSMQEADLQAQQGMARWAFLLLVTSYVGIFVTAAGVYYVAQTLREVRITTQAALYSNELTRQAHEAARLEFVDQHRPWVTLDIQLDEIEYRDDEIGALLLAVVKNIGQYPAVGVNIDCEAYWSLKHVAGKQKLTEFASGRMVGAGAISLMPGEESSMAFRLVGPIWPLSIDDVPAKGSAAHVSVAGVVDYHSVVSGTKRQTGHLYFVGKSAKSSEYPKRFGDGLLKADAVGLVRMSPFSIMT